MQKVKVKEDCLRLQEVSSGCSGWPGDKCIYHHLKWYHETLAKIQLYRNPSIRWLLSTMLAKGKPRILVRDSLFSIHC